MEPMSKAQKQEILKNNPQATPELIEEYQTLLAEKFAAPASSVHTAEAEVDNIRASDVRDEISGRNERIQELRGLLFPAEDDDDN
jgi:hypothetical protein